MDQSHLTQVQVGFGDEGEPPLLAMFQGDTESEEEEEEELLRQVDHAYIEMKENIDENSPQPEVSPFLVYSIL